MREVQKASNSEIVFRTPWLQRAWSWFTLLIGFLVIGIFVPFSLWIGLAMTIWNTPPWWWLLVGLGMVATGMCLVARFTRRHLVDRLSLLDEGFRLDGLRHGTVIPYEDVRLLRLEDEKNRSIGVGGLRRFEIECRSGAKHTLWLSGLDARECMEALTDLCERAGTVTLQGRVSLPMDVEARIEAQEALARGYWRRGAGVLVLVGLLSIPLAAAAYSLLTTGTLSNLTTATAYRLCFHLVAVFIGGIAAFRFFRGSCTLRRAARQARAENTDDKPRPPLP